MRWFIANGEKKYSHLLTNGNGLLVKWDNSAMAWRHREFDSPTVHQTWVTLADSCACPKRRMVGSNPTQARQIMVYEKPQIKYNIYLQQCPGGVMVATADSKSAASTACRFESDPGYQLKERPV